MKRKLVVAVSVVVLALLVVGTVSAQGGPGGSGGRGGMGQGPMWDDGDPSDNNWPGMMGGMMHGMMGRGYGMHGQSLIETVAELAGIDVADVQTELSDGATLAEVLEAHDVTVDALKEALLAGHAEQLAQAVMDETMTQAQADAMQALMAANLDARLDDMLSATWSDFGHRHGFGWNQWSSDDSAAPEAEEIPAATPQASS